MQSFTADQSLLSFANRQCFKSFSTGVEALADFGQSRDVGQLQVAIESLEQCVQGDPSSHFANFQLGLAYAASGASGQGRAKEAFKQAAKSPNTGLRLTALTNYAFLLLPDPKAAALFTGILTEIDASPKDPRLNALKQSIWDNLKSFKGPVSGGPSVTDTEI